MRCNFSYSVGYKFFGVIVGVIKVIVAIIYFVRNISILITFSYKTLSVSFVLAGLLIMAQTKPAADTSWKKVYRETATRINNLVHTKLELKPDFSKSWLYGKAWITLKPHFYPTDSLTLDAKGMEIKKINLVKGSQQVPLKFSYDDWQLKIQLDKTYKASESYTVYVEYTAKPDEFEEKYAKDAMLGIKGMYFINPRGEDKNKPT